MMVDDLHVYLTGDDDAFPVVYHHGTPNLGAPPEPLLADAQARGLRFIGYDRPGYGESKPAPDRDIASAATYTARIADHLGLDSFAVLGHSGGGPHALACAALLPGRVTAAVSISGPAPYDSPGLDWFAGMSHPASLQAATRGRAAKEAWEAAPDDEGVGFTPDDWAALRSDWSWFDSVVGPALAAGPAALIDDDLATVRPWGFDPAAISVPVLLLHGADDEMVPASHSRWLAATIPGAELRVTPGDGHLSVLHHAPAALEWLAARISG